MNETGATSLYHVTLEQSTQIAAEEQFEKDQEWVEVLLMPESKLPGYLQETVASEFLKTVKIHVGFGIEYRGNAPEIFPVGNLKRDVIYSSSSQKPALLYEEGASFCSLYLLFDDQGDAFLWHDPTSDLLTSKYMEEFEKARLDYYFDFQKALKGKKRLLLTATQATQDARDKVIENTKSRLAPDVEISMPMLPARETRDSFTFIHGCIYIPPSFHKDESKKAKATVILLAD